MPDKTAVKKSPRLASWPRSPEAITREYLSACRGEIAKLIAGLPNIQEQIRQIQFLHNPEEGLSKEDIKMRQQLDILIRRELALAVHPVDDRSLRRFNTPARRKEIRARIWRHIGLKPVRKGAAQNPLELGHPAGNMPDYDHK